MKAALLRALKQAKGEYISGQEISDILGVSRTTVFNTVSALRTDGYEIESVKNKGYLLKKVPDIIKDYEVESILETQWLGKKVVYEDSIGSTNTLAKELADKGYDNGTVVIADHQDNGRGRRGRSFVSPKGVGIFMSMILKPAFTPEVAPMLTLVSALSVSKAIDSVTGEKTQIKWPNDIVLNGKKICGILTEMSMQTDYINNVVIGIGINVNNTQFSEELQDIAGSIYLQTNQLNHRADIIAQTLYYFEKYYNVFLETNDLRGLVQEYDSKLVNLEKKVKVLDPKEPYEGVAKGITQTGELIVQTNKTTSYVSSGEVSVRGMYGYV